MRIIGTLITTATALLLQVQGLPAGSQATFSASESASLSEHLQAQLTIEGLLRHSHKLTSIANNNGNTRVFGSRGHNDTVRYIAQSALENGYRTWLERKSEAMRRKLNEFVTSFRSETALYLNYTETVKQSVHMVIPIPDDIPVRLMTFTESTPAEGVTAPLALVSGLGCSSSDYSDKIRNSIALVKRGECAFGEKAYEAGKAGAKALLIYNNEDGPLSGTLGQDFPAGAPTGGITKEAGEQLISFLENGDVVTLTVTIIEKREERLTYNVIAETKGGDKSKVIVIGAHSDSVSDGPGINDNGSGTAALLELSYLFRDVVPKYAVRFCWWTAEEFGLLGAKHTQMLADEKEREKIALYLNFDMIASPNAYNGIYQGSNGGPAGSGAIEKLFQDFFESQGAPYDPAEFDGRSDYGPFISFSIPSGGTFTGAEVPMTEEQAKRYKGGQAGVPYDKCYHQACDTIDNLNHDAFLLHAKAMAHAVATFSESLELLEKEQANADPKAFSVPKIDWPEGTLKGTKAI